MSPVAPPPPQPVLSLSTVMTMAPFSILNQNSALNLKKTEIHYSVHRWSESKTINVHHRLYQKGNLRGKVNALMK